MASIEVPGIGPIHFPEGMPQQEMEGAIKNMLVKQASGQFDPTQRSTGPVGPVGPVKELQPPPTMEEAKSKLTGLGRFIAEAALPTGGAMAGAAGGTAIAPLLGPFAPIAPIAGAMLGGMAGEAGTQAVGIKEPNVEDIALTGAMEGIVPGAGRLMGPVKGLVKKAASILPGVSLAQKQPLITQIKSLPGKFLPEQSSKELFGELAAAGDIKIQMPSAIRVAKELEGHEQKLMPKFRSPTIEGGAKQAEEFLAPTSEGISFDVAQDHLRRLGEMIKRAESGQTGENVAALRKMREAFMLDMEAAEKQFPMLMKANKTFKTEQSVAELKGMFETAAKPIAGKSGGKPSGAGAVQEFNGKNVLDKFNQLTNLKNRDKYDRLFTEGLGSENIKEIKVALQKINEFGPISVGWSGGGSLVAQGAVAGAGTGIASGLMFGDPTGGIASGLVGGLTGAAFPSMMAEALMRRPARAFLLRSLKSSGGKITHPDQFMAALGSVIQRSPTIFDEE